MSNSRSSFVFLEVLDPTAVNLLTNLRSILKGRESKSPIHITVRGPYKTPPSPKKLEHLWSLVQGEGLFLHGIGRFEFPDKHIVFIRSHSKAIRKIWWKRDFPIIHFGFNPHISLFEGTPKEAARVEKFLRNERIELFCRQLSLSLYERWQDDMFPSSTRSVVFESPPILNSVLQAPYRWKAGIEGRAVALINSFGQERVAL